MSEAQNVVEQTPYELLGGEAVLRRLVDRFYAIMESDPLAAPVRAMHPADLSSSADKLFWFLSGWLGGPNLFIERFGHPRLRGRHMPFAIDAAARDQWLYCMFKAMDELPLEPALRQHLETALARTADFMRNQDVD